MRPLRNASTAGSPGGLAKILQEAVRPEKAVDLLVVEDDPAQRFELLVLALGAELAGALGEVGEDHADWLSLRPPCTSTGTSPISLTSVRNSRRARLALGEKKSTKTGFQSAPIRLSISAHAIGIAGLGEAVELIFGMRSLVSA